MSMQGPVLASALAWLDEVRVDDTPRVGAKLARLGSLRAAGAHVPDGYVLTTDAFHAFIAPVREQLERILAAPPADLPGEEQVSHAAQALLEQAAFPSDMEAAIRAAHAALRDRTGLGEQLSVAVRSSGVSEDSAVASFAGQFDTYLGIREDEAVLTHVRRCWASQFSARSLDYRRRRGLPLTAAQGIAVGVMQLVNARSAGVTFTLDPVSGDQRYAVVEANWGFGESVVSGQTTPDHFLVDKARMTIVESQVGDKAVWSVFDARQGRVVETDAPIEQRGRACLSVDDVLRVVELAVRIEQREGCPQDVEWAIDAQVPSPGNLFLLQHRPVTA